MKDLLFPQLKRVLPGLRCNVPLKFHTTFKVGGPAKYFLVAQKAVAVQKAFTTTKNLGVSVFVLGGGSNILASDNGFDGLVIKIASTKKTFPVKKVGDDFWVNIEAGAPMKTIVAFLANRELSALEWAGGLPGTFGGAIRGNAGAFGGETKDSIVEVVALDEAGNIKKFSNKACQFSYRNSIFKQKNLVVLSALVRAKKGDKKAIWAVAKANMKYRRDKHPLDLPNAGSIFKNVDYAQFEEPLTAQLAHIVKKDPFPVVPTAYLLSEAGVKGVTFGGAQISPKHPNFIVNTGGAKAAHIVQAIEYNKQEIKKRYGVDLEQEVQFLGN